MSNIVAHVPAASTPAADIQKEFLDDSPVLNIHAHVRNPQQVTSIDVENHQGNLAALRDCPQFPPEPLHSDCGADNRFLSVHRHCLRQTSTLSIPRSDPNNSTDRFLELTLEVDAVHFVSENDPLHVVDLVVECGGIPLDFPLIF